MPVTLFNEVQIEHEIYGHIAGMKCDSMGWLCYDTVIVTDGG